MAAKRLGTYGSSWWLLVISACFIKVHDIYMIIWPKKFFYLPQFVLNVFRSDIYRGTFTMHWPAFYSNSPKKLSEPSRRN
ncbi:hypothetical protein RO3G_10938 [Rhizopus delemar RA 99-880]|uniref:Uncharacterized protein n=1 Tax=Rhizopus delemar (strain RA 99-880 / ATCC MYA-4621 / FGSC 9543 / NRRL 43880) TaxID=246409 RepID=I1CCP7_RHIO9|nr:hypothetical protein RO3G_10938 [Rhizopus delemar RA 99-880]|eukprot:EIE86227.1 hypothetical protein RO3G_10938 [Rhizopus delemar RA 99-880]